MGEVMEKAMVKSNYKDTFLAMKVKEGYDSKAFEDLYNRYSRVAEWYLNYEFGVEQHTPLYGDAMGNVRDKLWTCMFKFEPQDGKGFPSYARTVVRNAIVEVLRKHNEQVKHEAKLDSVSEVLEEPKNTEWEFVNNNIRCALAKFLATRDNRDRLIIKHHYGIMGCEEMSETEIAKELGITHQAVSKRIVRIEEDIRSCDYLYDAWSMAAA